MKKIALMLTVLGIAGVTAVNAMPIMPMPMPVAPISTPVIALHSVQISMLAGYRSLRTNWLSRGIVR